MTLKDIIMHSLQSVSPPSAQGKTDFGRRAFSSAASQIWNHIPAAINPLTPTVAIWVQL